MIKYTEVSYIDPELPVTPFLIESLSMVSPEHTHDYYEFFVMLSGSCRHVVNGETQLLTEGCLVFMRPADVHRYEADGDNDCSFLNVPCRSSLIRETLAFLDEPDFVDALLHDPLPRVVVLSGPETAEFVRNFERVQTLSALDKRKARLHLKTVLVELLTRYFLASQQEAEPFIPLWLEHAVAKMQSKDNLHRGLPALYELCGRSVGHVNRAFRQYLHQTPTEFINSLKLGAAKHLLLGTELRVVEIALEAGYDNVSHFYHQFKKVYGKAPLDFRRAARETRGG